MWMYPLTIGFFAIDQTNTWGLFKRHNSDVVNIMAMFLLFFVGLWLMTYGSTNNHSIWHILHEARDWEIYQALGHSTNQMSTKTDTEGWRLVLEKFLDEELENRAWMWKVDYCDAATQYKNQPWGDLLIYNCYLCGWCWMTDVYVAYVANCDRYLELDCHLECPLPVGCSRFTVSSIGCPEWWWHFCGWFVGFLWDFPVNTQLASISQY